MNGNFWSVETHQKTFSVVHCEALSQIVSALSFSPASVLADAAPIISACRALLFFSIWLIRSILVQCEYNLPHYLSRRCWRVHYFSPTLFAPPRPSIIILARFLLSRSFIFHIHTYFFSRTHSLAFSIPVHLLFSVCSVCRRKKEEKGAHAENLSPSLEKRKAVAKVLGAHFVLAEKSPPIPLLLLLP